MIGIRKKLREKDNKKVKQSGKDNLCGLISPLLNDDSYELEMYIYHVTYIRW